MESMVIDSTTSSFLSRFAKRYHFFISYSSKDAHFLESIAAPLQQHGLRVYFDRDSGREDKAPRWKKDTRGKPIPGNQSDISNALWNELSLSLVLLAIETKNYWRSRWAVQEFMFFFDQRLPIMVWHSNGDFWKTKRYIPFYYRLSKEAFDALIGEKELPFIIQHIPEGINEAEKAASRANLFLELIEFAQWHGEEITCENVEKYATTHFDLKIRSEELKIEIQHKFGRSLEITRTPVADLMPSKRTGEHKPWALREKEHLEQILLDEKYRERVFNELDNEGVSKKATSPFSLLNGTYFDWLKDKNEE